MYHTGLFILCKMQDEPIQVKNTKITESLPCGLQLILLLQRQHVDLPEDERLLPLTFRVIDRLGCSL